MTEAAISTYCRWIAVKDHPPLAYIPLYVVVDHTSEAGLREDRDHRYIVAAMLDEDGRFRDWSGELATLEGMSFVSHWRLADALPTLKIRQEPPRGQ